MDFQKDSLFNLFSFHMLSMSYVYSVREGVALNEI